MLGARPERETHDLDLAGDADRGLGRSAARDHGVDPASRGGPRLAELRAIIEFRACLAARWIFPRSTRRYAT